MSAFLSEGKSDFDYVVVPRTATKRYETSGNICSSYYRIPLQ